VIISEYVVGMIVIIFEKMFDFGLFLEYSFDKAQ
jgi:hypothetical protein